MNTHRHTHTHAWTKPCLRPPDPPGPLSGRPAKGMHPASPAPADRRRSGTSKQSRRRRSHCGSCRSRCRPPAAGEQGTRAPWLVSLGGAGGRNFACPARALQGGSCSVLEGGPFTAAAGAPPPPGAHILLAAGAAAGGCAERPAVGPPYRWAGRGRMVCWLTRLLMPSRLWAGRQPVRCQGCRPSQASPEGQFFQHTPSTLV